MQPRHTSPPLQRRQWLAAVAAWLGSRTCFPGAAAAGVADPSGAPSGAEAGLDLSDLSLAGSLSKSGARWERQARLLLPIGTQPTRLLILLHGRGEAGEARLALRAWSHLYGLMDAHRRLGHPPVDAILESPRIASSRLERINAELQARPFAGLAVVCPITPNPADYKDRPALFDAYADWLTGVLVPAVRQRVPSLGTALGLDGCSMGGYVALEVFLRKATHFSSFGTVQSAIGAWRVPQYARGVQQVLQAGHGAKLHLLTSTHDPFRPANEQLSRALHTQGTPHQLDVIEGAHDQAWLRQIGTLEMLHWHDRNL
jgi:hypothetical protein